MKPDDLFLVTALIEDQAGAQRGDVTSTVRLGYRYFTGSAGVADSKRAYSYFQSTEAVSPIAAAFRAHLDTRSSSDSVKKQATQRLQALSQSGDPIGQTLLGRAYEFGRGGLTASRGLAKQFYTSASPQFALAKTYLGQVLLQDGSGVKSALPLLVDASAAGETIAMYTLAAIYLGQLKDPKWVPQARRLLNTAAGRGDAVAMCRLGSLYAQPMGGAPATSHLGFHLLRRSALVGYPPARTATGIAYANGDGIKVNQKAAAYWLSKTMGAK